VVTSTSEASDANYPSLLFISKCREININPAGLRTVLVTGLPLLFDLKALQVLESALLSLFEEYSPEAVNIGTYVTYMQPTHL
jgi:hypothetical protein